MPLSIIYRVSKKEEGSYDAIAGREPDPKHPALREYCPLQSVTFDQATAALKADLQIGKHSKLRLMKPTGIELSRSNWPDFGNLHIFERCAIVVFSCLLFLVISCEQQPSSVKMYVVIEDAKPIEATSSSAQK